MNEEQIFTTEWLGRPLTLKTGKLAKQANAAVTVQYGDTVVLGTAVESKEERDADFFPLTVEFEERLYAAGIIKGSQWIKREGRPTDEAILSGRMIDRAIRPLFDEDSRKEVQVVLTVLSIDQENDYGVVSMIAASAALAISGIKWEGPIAGIKVGKVDGKFIFNPTNEEKTKSDLNLMVAGTAEKVIMIEADAKEIPEDEMYEALMDGLKKMQPAIKLIKEMQSQVAVPEKKEKKTIITQEEEEAQKEKAKIIELANGWLKENVNKILFDKTYYLKTERKAAVQAIKENLDVFLFENGIGKDHRSYAIKKTVEVAVEDEITQELIKNKRRVDGRGIMQIRKLSAEVNILPRPHGSALFSRGETQILSVVTLAAPGLAQSIEGLEGSDTKRYMHHYNFAPFSVGETKPMRGPGRREIGHGALAEKALVPVLPSKEDFPYTIRVVSETLGSNGSSSMGSTCCSSLALMHAGVPIKKAVAGVAIGLASNKDMSEWEVITDIQDLEDGKGGMDFKITGTEDGITAIQLDTKTTGLTADIVKEALRQGREGRMQILQVMNEAIAKPNTDLSPYAPRITSFMINPDKIREVIGAGGKVINKIIEETGVSIDIDDSGLVMVCGPDSVNAQRAIHWIKDIVHEFAAGEIYKGKVVRIMDFGAFVEILPGRDGMVHVSKLAPYRIGRPSDFVEVGDEVQVIIEEIDSQGRINLSMIGLPENEHLWKDKKGQDTRTGFSNPDRGGRDSGDRRSGGGFRDRKPNFRR